MAAVGAAAGVAAGVSQVSGAAGVADLSYRTAAMGISFYNMSTLCISAHLNRPRGGGGRASIVC